MMIVLMNPKDNIPKEWYVKHTNNEALLVEMSFNATYLLQTDNTFLKHINKGVKEIAFYSINSYLKKDLNVILSFVEFCLRKNITIFFLKQAIEINPKDSAAKVANSILAIQKYLLSDSIKDGIRKRVEEGKKAGRPKGSRSGNKLAKLGKDIEIRKYLKARVSITRIADVLGCHRITLTKYVNNNPKFKDLL